MSLRTQAKDAWRRIVRHPKPGAVALYCRDCNERVDDYAPHATHHVVRFLEKGFGMWQPGRRLCLYCVDSMHEADRLGALFDTDAEAEEHYRGLGHWLVSEEEWPVVAQGRPWPGDDIKRLRAMTPEQRSRRHDGIQVF